MNFINNINIKKYKSEINNRSISEVIILWFLILSPFIDMLNGVLKANSIDLDLGSIGILYRLVFLGILIFIIYMNGLDIKIQRFTMFALYMCILPLIFAFNHQSITGIIDDFLYLSKFLLPFLLCLALYQLRRVSKLEDGFIDKIMKIYQYIFPLSMIIPYILKIGYNTYHGTVGYKGLYHANNEINIVLVCICILSIDDLLKDIKAINIIKAGMAIFALLLIGSKTSLFSLIAVISIYSVKYIIMAIIKKDLIKVIRNISIVLIGICIIFTIFSESITKVVDYTVKRYEINTKSGVDSSNISNFLFTGRNKRIDYNLSLMYFESEKPVSNFLLGIGKYQKSPDLDIKNYSLVEMDLLDLLFWFGIIPIIYVILYYGNLIFNKNNYKRKFKWWLSIVFMAMFSITAGHVIFSALSGTVLALITFKLKIN